jgi:hypothetical protein
MSITLIFHCIAYLIVKGANGSDIDDSSDDLGSDCWPVVTAENTAILWPEIAQSIKQQEIANRSESIRNWLSGIPVVDIC